jgi:hypothetical protein
MPTKLLRNYTALFAVFFLLQGIFWWHSLAHKPRLEIVPSVPSEVAVKAIAFGDHQFFFRVLGFYLQNFGDTFGRYTPLKEYDYDKLHRWFLLLDTLDRESNYIPSMASYYFSQSQNAADTRYVVDYLRKHAEGRLQEKWWWQAQAVYLANHRLHDSALALELALPLVHARNVPIWVNQLAAFIYEKQGEFAAAYGIMEHLKQNIRNIPAGELRFMEHFVKERLQAMDQQSHQQSEGVSP